ncbi:putative transcriptional regulator [archaeon]|nr:putative transcriptional regulator [archaeon]
MKVGILTYRQAEIFKYHTLGYSQEEISKLLDISQPRVSAALKEAKKKIENARETLKFLEELNYLNEMKSKGFKGDLILR